MIEQFYRKMLWAGAYPLLLALMAGATWMDRIYAHSLRGVVPQGELALALQRVSDRLLLLSAVVLLAGAFSAWLLSGIARKLIIASLAVFCLEFLLPVAATALPGGAIYFAMLGPGLRVGIMLTALSLSVLATHRVLA